MHYILQKGNKDSLQKIHPGIHSLDLHPSATHYYENVSPIKKG